jgi:hypothetical protein
LERFVGYALEKAGDKRGALDYFKSLRREMGNPPNSARRPEVVEREIARLEKGMAEGKKAKTK